MTRGREKGATAVEYALIVATCGLAVALSWQALDAAVEAGYEGASNSVGTVPEE